MTTKGLKVDLPDRILIDLYEKEAFSFYQQPSDKLTGKASNNMMRKLCALAKYPDSKEDPEDIYRKINEQVKAYHNAVNFLLANDLIKQNIDQVNSLYYLRLTLSGVAMAKSSIKAKLESENTLFIRKISNQNKWLTGIIALATIVNILIALNVIPFNNYPSVIEDKVNPVISSDTTISRVTNVTQPSWRNLTENVLAESYLMYEYLKQDEGGDGSNQYKRATVTDITVPTWRNWRKSVGVSYNNTFYCHFKALGCYCYAA